MSLILMNILRSILENGMSPLAMCLSIHFRDTPIYFSASLFVSHPLLGIGISYSEEVGQYG